MKLLKWLCASPYGMKLFVAAALRRLSCLSNFALKLLIGLTKHFSFCGIHIWSFLNYRMIKFYTWLKETNNVCTISHKHSLMNHSRFAKYMNSEISNVYEFRDVISNAMDTKVSGIGNVQLHEPFCSYMQLIFVYFFA